jgi:FixJ family two-component response regulator
MNSNSPVVFVVDDDHRVQEALSILISSVGLRGAVFASAAEFLESEKPDAPACLVLDLQLPGASGLELQQQLSARQLAGGDAPPIVFITGHGDIPSSVRAIKAGAIELLSKPFDEEELLQAIDAAIDQDRIARQKRSELAELQRHYNLLTPREREVLPFVVAGFANKQTGADLGTSEITIGVHRGSLVSRRAADQIAADGNDRLAAFRPERCHDVRRARAPVKAADSSCLDLERIHQSDDVQGDGRLPGVPHRFAGEKTHGAIAAQVRNDHPVPGRGQQRRNIGKAVNVVGPAV